MSVDKFLAIQHGRMIARAEGEVLDWSVDHMTAHTILRRMAVALALVRREGGEEAFYTKLHQDLLERLADRGVEAELYKLRGNLTADNETDSRVFLRVISRPDRRVESTRRTDILCRAVVLASTKNDVLSKREE